MKTKNDFGTTLLSLFPKTDKDTDRQINLENLQALRFAVLTVAVADFVFLSGSLIYSVFSFLPAHYFWLIASCGTSCLLAASLISFCLRRYRKSGKFNNVLVGVSISVFYMLMSFMSLQFDIGVYKEGNQMLFFYIVQFCFMLFISFRPLLCLALVGTSFTIFILQVVIVDGGESFNFTSFFIFFCLAMFGNTVKYASAVKRFTANRDLLIQKEENEIVVAQSGKFISHYDVEKDVLYNSSEAMETFGLSEVVPAPSLIVPNMDFILPDSREDIKEFFEQMRKGVPNGKVDVHVKSKDGNTVWRHGDYTLQADDSGKYVQGVISFSDITVQMEAKAIHTQRINEVISLTKDCDFFFECSVDRWEIDRVTILNENLPQTENIEGKNIDDVLSTVWKDMIYVDDYKRVREFFDKARFLLLNANGVSSDKIELNATVADKNVRYCVDICIVRSEDTKEIDFFAICRDISDAQKNYEILLNKATKDNLTGLYNREATMRLIEDYLLGEGKDNTHALFMLDMDNLKELNDSMGHQMGDEALHNVGLVLMNTFDEADICGRVGGDEFFVFQKNTNIEKVVQNARRVLVELDRVYSGKNSQITTSVSIGIALYKGSDETKKTMSTLYSEADAALYKSKAMGKNTFVFADELDALAAVSSSSSYLKSEVVSYNLRGLLDNLANGIAIFHGKEGEKLMPTFCNENLAKLFGIKRQDFANWTREDHGVHPDDYQRMEEAMEETVHTEHSTKGTYRMLCANGEYTYISVIFNAHVLDDGSYDLYCVFSVADDMEKAQRAKEERHREILKKRMMAAENNVSYMLLNTSKNIVIESHFNRDTLYPIDTHSTVEAFTEGLVKNISSDEVKEAFAKKFMLGNCEKEIKNGIFSKSMKLPMLLKGKGVHWLYNFTELSLNPETDDVEAFVTFTDIDNEMRLGYVVDQILEDEYEYICQVDVQTGCLTQIGKTKNAELLNDQNGNSDYREVYKESLKKLFADEYYEEGIEALSLEHIIAQLDSAGDYTCIFPVKGGKNGGNKRICQWHCEYVDSNHSTILITRANVSKFMNFGFDPLTGALSRTGFYQRARAEFLANPNDKYYILEFDIDGFKIINEEGGYTAGNNFLCILTTLLRLKTQRLGRALIGRFEADHFVVLMPKREEYTPENIYSSVAEELYSYPEYGKRFKLRLGVYEVLDTTEMDISGMCDYANLANKSCREGFARDISYFNAEMKDRILEEQILAADMQIALTEGQFEVWYQPQVNHATGGSLIGAEALIRWHHPTRGTVSPASFIPIAEQNGFVYDLDKFVWREAAAFIRKRLDEEGTVVPISVNVSRNDIMQPDFLKTVFSIVKEYGIPNSLMHLEITESSFNEDYLVMSKIIGELIDEGFIIAVDDFGSGYSSLSMLRTIPAQILKLDMRFFEENGDHLRNQCIIESIIRMGKMLGMAVLAEGVEEPDQADFLLSVGCNYIQGYLYSRPLKRDDFVNYIFKAGIGNFATAVQEGEEKKNDGSTHELFRGIITNTNDVILVADIATKRLLYANDAAERFYGKRFDPYVSQTCMEFCDEGELCKNCPVYNGIDLDNSEDMVFERNGNHMKARVGKMRWNGHDALVMYQTDITGEIKELQLADSLIRNIPGAVISFDGGDEKEIKVRYISERAMLTFRRAGINKAQPDYNDFLSVIHPEDRERIKIKTEELIETKESLHEEFRVMLKNGNIMWVDLMESFVEDKYGHFQLYGIYADITDRKNSQARLNSVIQTIPSAITVYEVKEGLITRIFISDSAKEILQAPENTHEEVGMEEIFSRIHPNDRAAAEKYILSCVEKKEPFSLSFRLANVNRWVHLESKPIVETGRDSVYYYSDYTDITAQKRIEQVEYDSSDLVSIQEAVNEGIALALKQPTPEKSLDFILRFMGLTVSSKRAYIFERSGNGAASNTFEWTADGVESVKAKLQNVPEVLVRPWYDTFNNMSTVIVNDREDIKDQCPEIYTMLRANGISSLIAAPLYNDKGETMGFVGLDDPLVRPLELYSNTLTAVAHYVEAVLKRCHADGEKAD